MTSFSIIIPHKNSPCLLQRCLDSIPQHDGLHVIIVDDNSDTNKVDFKNFPGLTRKDVEVFFTKEGKGAGYARNVGLQHAHGEWVLFADADDYFTESFLLVLNEIDKCQDDVVFFKHISVSSEDSTNKMNRCEELNAFVDLYFDNPHDGELYLRQKWCVPWAKIIRKQLIDDNQIWFSESRYANDVFFSIQVGLMANSIMALNYDAYVATVRDGSLSYDFCGTSEEVRIRLTEALKTDRFIEKKTNKVSSGLMRESDVILWYIYREKGRDYLWKCAKDCVFDTKVFLSMVWFLLKRSIKR